jgi:alkyl hydroperoxide reductase subunit AhpC
MYFNQIAAKFMVILYQLSVNLRDVYIFTAIKILTFMTVKTQKIGGKYRKTMNTINNLQALKYL